MLAASGVDWSAVSAIATLLAVIVSLSAFWYQREHQCRQRDEENFHQRRAQASYVSVWYDDARQLIWIENRSEQPIYDVGATLHLPEPDGDGRPYLSLHEAGGFLRFLAPRHRVFINSKTDLEDPVPILAFRDSQGVTWERDRLGHLRELGPDVSDRYGLPPEFSHVGVPQPF